MTDSAGGACIVLSLAWMAGEAGVTPGYLPHVGLVAGLARASAVRSRQVHSLNSVAGHTVNHRLRLLVRHVTVTAGVLHGGVRSPGNPVRSQHPVAIKASVTCSEKLPGVGQKV